MSCFQLPEHGGPHVGQPARRTVSRHKDGQAGHDDGVAVGNVAFDLEQVVLRMGKARIEPDLRQFNPLSHQRLFDDALPVGR